MADRIQLHVGPAPSALVRRWIENRRRFVELALRDPHVVAKPEALDLLEMILGLWSVEVEREETFDWTYDFDHEVFLIVAEHWLSLGEVAPEARAAIGVPPLDAEAESFTGVVVDGMVDALRAAGPPAQPLLDRLGLGGQPPASA